MSGENPLVNTHSYFKASTSAAKGSMARKMHEAPPLEAEEEVRRKKEFV
jgi:hypothetical protein